MAERRARVRVPASTSNLGSGFDCVGLAVGLWLTAEVVVRPATGAVTLARGGTLAGLDLPPEEDLLHLGFQAACGRADAAVPAGLEYRVESEVPVARGLGSSAAAFVAGARLANQALGLGLDAVDIAELGATAEGHPDNAAPAALGGAVLGVPAVAGPRRYVFSRLEVHPELAFVFAIPAFEVATAAARAALPASLPHAVAVTAAAKSAALVQGLAAGDADLLAAALHDVLHVPFRRALIPGCAEVEEAARRAGAFGTTLSGSGSTLMAVSRRADAAGVAAAMAAAWLRTGVAARILRVDRPVEADPGEPIP